MFIMAVSWTHAVGLADGSSYAAVFTPKGYHERMREISLLSVSILHCRDYLLYGLLFVLVLEVRQLAAVTPELLRRQSITEFVGVRVSNYLDSTVRHTDLSVAPSSWPLPSHATISQTCHVALSKASLPRLVTHPCIEGVSSQCRSSCTTMMIRLTQACRPSVCTLQQNSSSTSVLSATNFKYRTLTTD
jgi:hypothetical protein